MKSLNFHVCHILPPYRKACPHVLKSDSTCAPPCGSQSQEGTQYINQNNQNTNHLWGHRQAHTNNL